MGVSSDFRAPVGTLSSNWGSSAPLCQANPPQSALPLRKPCSQLAPRDSRAGQGTRLALGPTWAACPGTQPTGLGAQRRRRRPEVGPRCGFHAHSSRTLGTKCGSPETDGVGLLGTFISHLLAPGWEAVGPPAFQVLLVPTAPPWPSPSKGSILNSHSLEIPTRWVFSALLCAFLHSTSQDLHNKPEGFLFLHQALCHGHSMLRFILFILRLCKCINSCFISLEQTFWHGVGS